MTAVNLQKIKVARQSSVAVCFEYLKTMTNFSGKTIDEKRTNKKPPDDAAEPKKTALSLEDLATEYLANKRTFLAWVRTGIAVITLGFALARVRVWLGEFLPHGSPNAGGGESIPLGIGMLLFGGLLVVLAAWRFSVVNGQIRRGEVTADRWMIVLVTIAVVILTCLTTLYFLLGAREM